MRLDADCRQGHSAITARAGVVVMAAVLLAACSGDEPEPGSGVCLGVSQAPLLAVDRKIIGVAAPYEADGTLRVRESELAASQRARREVAWQTVDKVLAEVPLAETLPIASQLPARIPSWQTWYDQEDLRRVFLQLYEGLSQEQKEQRAHFTDAALDEAFIWNTTAVEELASWPAKRYLAYLDSIDDAGEVAGLGGISRISFSPAAARHILQSYPQVLGCREDGAPDVHEVGRTVATPVAREPVELAPCAEQLVGSYAIDADESLQIVLEEGADAILTASAGQERCIVAAGKPCELFGPATVQVEVTAGSAPLRSIVDITRYSTKPPWSACLDGPFPHNAVVIKADYRRADFGMLLPLYHTSAEALAQRLSGAYSWELANGEADPPPSDIYTLTLPGGEHYRLAALHIMTKELDHWQWVTLWWSDSPATDFGADRPADLTAIKGPWRNYKMCVVTAFEEGDERADGGFDEHPSLASALAASYSGQGAPTWCSNPYLEVGHGNAGTNCVGCHQHGGTLLLSDQVLELDERGRTLLRNNFPADYSWAAGAPGELGALFADTELYYLGAP